MDSNISVKIEISKITYLVISMTTFLQFNFFRSLSICPSSFSSPSLLYYKRENNKNINIKKYNLLSEQYKIIIKLFMR